MGEVYRARDTQLKRDVAIKVLPPAFAEDPDRLARFQREAEVLATLNHPNIAAIYGLEEGPAEAGLHASGGRVRALVMELVEGETVAQRIEGLRAKGSGLPMDEALAIARQIADALEAAHEKGIVHRDLKPANIKVTADGKVKVLDFGLAKHEAGGAGRAGPEVAQGFSPAVSESPTLTTPGKVTGAGMILGTAAYMSPEQARGKPVDKRADIWAFGCVLFEMLTGHQVFPASETVSDAIAAILTREPDWNVLPVTTPDKVRALLLRCLRKDPSQRLRDIGDARLDIDEAVASPGVPVIAAPSIRARPPQGWLRALPWAVGVAGLAAAGAVISTRSPSVGPRTAVRLSAEIGADASLVTDQGPAAVLSPDGNRLVFVAQKTDGAVRLFTRPIDQITATELARTDNARGPFFSPDGQWIGFFADGKLKKVPFAGGAVIVLCDAPIGRGASWAEDGTIVFRPSTGSGSGMLLHVASEGGQPGPLTTITSGENNQRWPQVLAGGRAVLYTSSTTAGSYNDATISVQTLTDHVSKVLVRGGYFGRYVPSGHLVYMHDGTLFAVPFDVGRLEVTGAAVPAIEHVAGNTTLGAAQVVFSDTGMVAYRPEEKVGGGLPITWLRRDGRTDPLRAAPIEWSNLQFAPDGRRIALDFNDSRQTDIWTYEWDRDALTRLTFDQAEHWNPIWAPDGRRIAFRNSSQGRSNLFWIRADGGATAERLTDSPNSQFPGSWHPSGKFLAFTEVNPTTSGDLMILPVEGSEASGWKPGTPFPFLNSTVFESEPAFSPDGRWIAYQSLDGGRNEVYVRPFPGPGGKWQISTSGGVYPTWSRTRKELLFLSPDGQIVVAAYTADADTFKANKPRLWSDRRLSPRPRGNMGTEGRSFDLHPDGERLAVSVLPQGAADGRQDKVVFIFNFFDELRRIAPVRK
jgi:serine/threonine-protein kinase